MLIKCEDSLSDTMVHSLLMRFDMSFDEPLHDEIDFIAYSKKLSLHAHFILAYNDNDLMGFISYYINEEGQFAYVPFIAVHQDCRHQGVGHLMLSYLLGKLSIEIKHVRLEVKESNAYAQMFYKREGFYVISEPNKGRILLNKDL